MTSEALLGGEISPEEIAELLRTPGGRIRFMRLTKGMKQAALADQVHTTQASISLYETGARRPGPLMRNALADALGVSASFENNHEATPQAVA
jgi:transcriptional regulator with XRE-family HTH domain